MSGHGRSDLVHGVLPVRFGGLQIRRTCVHAHAPTRHTSVGAPALPRSRDRKDRGPNAVFEGPRGPGRNEGGSDARRARGKGIPWREEGTGEPSDRPDPRAPPTLARESRPIAIRRRRRRGTGGLEIGGARPRRTIADPDLPPLWQWGSVHSGLAGDVSTIEISRHLDHVTALVAAHVVDSRTGTTRRRPGRVLRTVENHWEERDMGWKEDREAQGWKRSETTTNRHRSVTEEKRCENDVLVHEIVVGMENREQATSHRIRKRARDRWYLPHRDGLVDWMVVAAEDLSLSATTLATAVYCMDRALSKTEVSLGKLYLVAASCLLVAAKFEEREVDVPSLRHMTNYMGRMYTTQSFIDMEKDVLKAISWKITCCSYAHCLDMYLSLICETPFCKEQEAKAWATSAQDRSDLVQTASVMITHVLYSTEILNMYKPAAIAVAILSICMDHLSWDADLQRTMLAKVGDWCCTQEVTQISQQIHLICRLKFPEHCIMQDLITGGFSHSTMGAAGTSPQSTLDMSTLLVG